MSRDLTTFEMHRIHWGMLRLSLPPEGIAKRYPTERACRDRLMDVRWPDGPICTRCESTNLGRVEDRLLFQCQACRKQFSVTSGTLLHGSHLPIRGWFLAAECVIGARRHDLSRYFLPASSLMETVRTSYATAIKLRRVLDADLKKGGRGLFRTTLLTNMPSLPSGILSNSPEHLHWVNTELVKPAEILP